MYSVTLQYYWLTSNTRKMSAIRVINRAEQILFDVSITVHAQKNADIVLNTIGQYENRETPRTYEKIS